MSSVCLDTSFSLSKMQTVTIYYSNIIKCVIVFLVVIIVLFISLLAYTYKVLSGIIIYSLVHDHFHFAIDNIAEVYVFSVKFTLSYTTLHI